jgi:MarR family protease production transcriptional regulator HPr
MDFEIRKQLLLMIRALYFSQDKNWSELGKVHNVSPAQQHILFILSTNNSPLTITDISKYGFWHVSTVTRIIRPLHKEKYVSIQYDRHRSKSKYVTITELGRKKLQDITDEVSVDVNFPLNLRKFAKEDIKQFIEQGLAILHSQKSEEIAQWIKESEMKEISYVK